MATTQPSADKCKHCHTLKVMTTSIDGRGPRKLRCPKCDEVDPLEVPAYAGWIAGELRPPK